MVDSLIESTHTIESNGCPILIRNFKPDTKQSENGFVIHILHGMAEHSLRYRDFATYLVGKGYVVYAHDHRKHGYSKKDPKELGMFNSKDKLERMLEDIANVQIWILNREKAKKLILIGHSMGSLLGRCYLTKAEDRLLGAAYIGTASSKPFLCRMGILLGHLIKLVNGKDQRSYILNKLAVGAYNSAIKAPRTLFDWLTHDDDIVDAFIADPLCGYAYSADFYIQLSRMVIKCNDNMHFRRIPEIPIIILSGSEDPVGHYSEGVHEVYEKYRKYTSLVTVKIYDGFRHEILNETNKEIVYEDIAKWLENFHDKKP